MIRTVDLYVAATRSQSLVALCLFFATRFFFRKLGQRSDGVIFLTIPAEHTMHDCIRAPDH